MGRSREESMLQRACVRWFAMQYPKHSRFLFAVPNGGSRNKIEAYNLKLEGVQSGVSDLLLLLPTGDYHGLCIEMKTMKGRVQASQREFLELMDGVGYRSVIIRSADAFMEEVTEYMKAYEEYSGVKLRHTVRVFK